MLKTLAKYMQDAPRGHIGDWHQTKMTPHQLAILEKECLEPSEFDEILSKQQLYKQYKEGIIQPYVCKHILTGDIVIALFPEPNLVHDVPWALWSQIVQLYRRPNHQPHTIFLLAHPALREFPAIHKHITSRHINGGYTYPCNADGVIVFRAEDATRVLIHELFHSNCCDTTALTLEEREAETEAWAELFWCGLVSRGDLKTLKSLVRAQGSLIRTQNRRIVEGAHMKKGYQGFPWRYTIGKGLLWARWGLLKGTTDQAPIGDSLRLTLHLPAAVKKSFGITASSTML
jgi:hypothetical protein